VPIYATVPADLSKHLPGRKYDRQFFFAVTVLLAVVVIGFAPTYFVAGGFLAPLRSRIVHLPKWWCEKRPLALFAASSLLGY
jgi:hypothetical protein